MSRNSLNSAGLPPLAAQKVSDAIDASGAVGEAALQAAAAAAATADAAVPAQTAATYSETAADIAAVLVAHGMMEPSA